MPFANDIATALRVGADLARQVVIDSTPTLGAVIQFLTGYPSFDSPNPTQLEMRETIAGLFYEFRINGPDKWTSYRPRVNLIGVAPASSELSLEGDTVTIQGGDVRFGQSSLPALSSLSVKARGGSSDITTRSSYAASVKTSGGAVNLGAGGAVDGEYVDLGNNVVGTVRCNMGAGAAAAAGTFLVSLPRLPNAAAYFNQPIGAALVIVAGVFYDATAFVVPSIDGAFARVVANNTIMTAASCVGAGNEVSFEFSYRT